MAGAARVAKRRSIREQGKRRQVRRTFYDMVVGSGDLAAFSASASKAERTLTAATLIAKTNDTPEAHTQRDAAQAVFDEAQAAVDARRERIWFSPIPEGEFEALRLAHPPTSNGPGGVWSFIPALLAACAEGYDDDAESWAEELAGWSRGEIFAIREAVLSVNTNPASLDLGKG